MPFGASKQPCADPFRGKALRPCRRWRLQRHLCGPGRIVNRRGRGLGRRAGSQRRLRRLPTRLGRDSRREIAGGPAPSTPSGRLARGITCPPPGVNRDPPAQAPAETIRPGGRPEEPRRSGTKAISPCVKSASAKLFLDLHTPCWRRERRGAQNGSRTGRRRWRTVP